MSDHNINIAGNVVQSIIINGDHNLVFAGQYESLRDSFISPLSFFESLRIDRFQGREWLLSEIDEFLNNYDRGLFILRGVAGAGKSAFLAHLVKQRFYVHNFASLTPGIGGITSAMLNLATQLIRDWQLESYTAQGFLPRSTIRPDFLQTIIFQAASKRDQLKPQEKIVIVVDGLDEAGTPYGHNAMGLPKTLPKGVYLIVSQRPVPATLDVDAPRKILELDIESKENFADIQMYIEGLIQRPKVISLLAQTGFTSTQFSKILTEKSHGLWIYVHCIESQLEDGQSLNLAELPDGIIQYYARFWLTYRTQDIEQWNNVLLPILATLATAKEPISLSVLRNWSAINQPDSHLTRIVEEMWKPLIVSESKEGENRYRFYHATLNEFLSGEVNRDTLSDSERILIDETSRAVRNANGRIADYFFNSWGGWGTTLDGLKEDPLREQNHQYGLNYLITHLVNSHRSEQIHELLKLTRERYFEISVPQKRRLSNLFSPKLRLQQQSFKENVWYVAHKDSNNLPGYLHDNDIAWRLAEQGTHNAKCIALQIQYALVRASINSHLNNTVPELLPWLLENHIWDYEQIKLYTKAIQNPEKRGRALLSIINQLTQEEGDLLRDVSREFSGEVGKYSGSRAQQLVVELGEMLKHLIGLGYSEEAFQQVEAQEPPIQIELYSRLVAIAAEARQAGLQYAKSLQNPVDRLQALLLFLPAENARNRELQCAEIIQLILSIRSIDIEEPEVWKFPLINAQVLEAFLPRLSHSLALVLLDIYSRAFPGPANKIYVLSRLAPYLPPKSRQSLIEKSIQEIAFYLSFAYFSFAVGHVWQDEIDELMENTVTLLNYLPTEKKKNLACLIVDHAESATRWQWWKHIFTRIKAGEFQASEDLLPLLPMAMDLFGSIVKFFNKQADNESLVLKQSWMISLYKYYQLCPERFPEYQRKLNKSLATVNPSKRIHLLTEMMPILEGSEREFTFRVILQLLLQLPPEERKKELRFIVPWFTQEIESSKDKHSIEILLSMSENIDDWKDQAWFYSGLIPYASDQLRKYMLPAVLSSVPAMSDRVRTWALVDIMPYLNENLFQSAVKIAKEEKSKNAFWMDRLYFPGNSLAAIMSVAKDERRRRFIFKQVANRFLYAEQDLFFADAASYLPDSIVEKALEEAQKNLNSLQRALMVGVLIGRLPPIKQRTLLNDVQKVLSEVEDDIRSNLQTAASDRQVDASSPSDKYSLERKQDKVDRIRERIAAALEDFGLVDDAIHILLAGNTPRYRLVHDTPNPKIRRLTQIVRKLSLSQLDMLVEQATELLIGCPDLLVSVFARYMALEAVVEAYEVLIFHHIFKTKATLDLLKSDTRFSKELTDEEDKKELWLLCLVKLVNKYASFWSVESALDILCQEIPQDIILDAVKVVDKTAGKYFQVEFFTSIIGRTPNKLRHLIVKHTVQLIGGLYEDDPPLLHRRDLRDKALVVLCKKLAKATYIQEALNVVKLIEEQDNRDNAVLQILLTLESIDYVSVDMLRSLVEATLKMKGKNIIQMRGFQILGRLLTRLPNDQIYPSWCAIWSCFRDDMRQDVFWYLRGLMPAVHRLGGQAAVDETFRAVENVRQWWP